MQYLNITKLWKGNVPLRDVMVDPIIEKGDDVTVSNSENGKKYVLTNEELKNPLYSMKVNDFKNRTSRAVHELHYYPAHLLN